MDQVQFFVIQWKKKFQTWLVLVTLRGSKVNQSFSNNQPLNFNDELIHLTFTYSKPTMETPVESVKSDQT